MGRKSIHIATVLLILSLTACQGGTLLEGTITDISGKPISSAFVTLEVLDGSFSKGQEQSNDQGSYHVHVTHYPKRTYLIVTVSKPGFESFRKKFLSKGTIEHLDVKLKPADASSVRSGLDSQG